MTFPKSQSGRGAGFQPARARTDSTVVLFALRRESMYFVPRLSHPRKVPAPFPTWESHLPSSGRVLVLETGVGEGRTRSALEWLESRANGPYRLISAGFGGALDPALKVGDVVRAGAVLEARGQLYPLDRFPGPRLVTVPRLLARPEEKKALAQRLGAQMVDMESAAVARFAQARGVPLTCLRAISDEAGTELSPHLVSLLGGGRVSGGKLTWALLRRPWLVRQLWQLGQATRLAGRNLAAALHECLANLKSENPPYCYVNV